MATEITHPQRLGTYADGARIANVHAFTVGRWAREGIVGLYRVGTRPRVDLDEVAAFVTPFRVDPK